MAGIFIDFCDNPNTDEEFEDYLVNAFKKHYKDEDIFFDEMFLTFEDKILENANKHIFDQHSKTNLYNFNTLSRNGKRDLINKFYAVSFSTEYKEGLLVGCKTFRDLLNSFLLKTFTDKNIISNKKRFNQFGNEYSYYGFVRAIATKDDYFKVLNDNTTISMYERSTDIKMFKALVMSAKKDLNTFVYNLKLTLEQEYKRKIVKETAGVDLTEYIKELMVVMNKTA